MVVIIILVLYSILMIQLNILRRMSYIDIEQEQNELQDILLQVSRQKADRLLLQFQRGETIFNRHWMIGLTSTREHRAKMNIVLAKK